MGCMSVTGHSGLELRWSWVGATREASVVTTGVSQAVVKSEASYANWSQGRPGLTLWRTGSHQSWEPGGLAQGCLPPRQRVRGGPALCLAAPARYPRARWSRHLTPCQADAVVESINKENTQPSGRRLATEPNAPQRMRTLTAHGWPASRRCAACRRAPTPRRPILMCPPP